MRMWKYPSACLIALVCSHFAFAQIPASLMMAKEPTQVSGHVYMLKGFPNVAIIVGDRATLVVDTGLGNANGLIVAEAAKKLAKGPTLYLTTTHYHPEHAGGEGGFPASTVLVRNQAQQIEVNDQGMKMIERFSERPEMKDLLAESKFRDPDIIFDHELQLDLGGGVKAKLFWLGAAHTFGDEMVFVEPDETLVSGDVVQNKQAAAAGGDRASVKTWLAILDQLGGLRAKIVLPDHSDPGEASQLIQETRKFLADLRDQAVELKHQGVSADDAATKVTESLKAMYPDWETWFGVPGTVKKVYAEYD
jgi:glyoxylase-like metal-dependent hydrolase (beta-lactamase superfamily II)